MQGSSSIVKLRPEKASQNIIGVITRPSDQHHPRASASLRKLPRAFEARPRRGRKLDLEARGFAYPMSLLLLFATGLSTSSGRSRGSAGFWDSLIANVVLLAESLEIAFKRTKKKYDHCNIRIYDRHILDWRLRTNGGRKVAGERPAISQGGFYRRSQNFAFRHYFARLSAETLRKRGRKRSWAIFAQNGSRTADRFVIRGS